MATAKPYRYANCRRLVREIDVPTVAALSDDPGLPLATGRSRPDHLFVASKNRWHGPRKSAVHRVENQDRHGAEVRAKGSQREADQGPDGWQKPEPRLRCDLGFSAGHLLPA